MPNGVGVPASVTASRLIDLDVPTAIAISFFSEMSCLVSNIVDLFLSMGTYFARLARPTGKMS
jgi:hypothetical protein